MRLMAGRTHCTAAAISTGSNSSPTIQTPHRTRERASLKLRGSMKVTCKTPSVALLLPNDLGLGLRQPLSPGCKSFTAATFMSCPGRVQVEPRSSPGWQRVSRRSPQSSIFENTLEQGRSVSPMVSAHGPIVQSEGKGGEAGHSHFETVWR